VSAQFGSIGSSPTSPESPELGNPINNESVSDTGASYNSDGQVTGTTFQLGQSSESNSYTYDADSQLLSSSGASDDTYGYDANGNRDTTGYTVGTGNELTTSPGVTYTYDNDGNMLTATTPSGTTTYTYDYQNQLTNVEANGVMVATYTYDALGQRIGIKDNGTQTWTVYNGNSADANPYADFNGSNALKVRYLDGLAVDEILAQTDASGNTEWYLTDQLGSVVAIASTSAILDQITYDPFGNIVTQTNATDSVRFGFAGMEYDSVTGLYYDHARYYDAVIGRFTSQDPMGFAAGDTNLYRYVNNGPSEVADPTGEDIYLVPGNPIALGYRHITVVVTDPVSGWYKEYNGGGPGGSPGTQNGGSSPNPGGGPPTATSSPILSGPFPTYGMKPVLVAQGNFNLQIVKLNTAFRVTKQIPFYDAWGGPNSNTWANQFLQNGGFSPPTPPGGVGTGWGNGAYGGTPIYRPEPGGGITTYRFNRYGQQVYRNYAPPLGLGGP
jgi:RHS repeat-associated protein